MTSRSQTVHLSLDRPTGNFWIDAGTVVLVRRFGAGTYPIQTIMQGLVQQLVQPSGNRGQYLDLQTGEIREYDKVNWVYPTNLFIKVSGSAPKIEIEDEKEKKKKKYFTRPPVFDLKLKLSQKAGICDICGDQAPLTEATMWMYPFVVDPQKFGTFYPGTKRGLRLCARCALAGLAGYLGWLWKAQGQTALHFFIFHTTDLWELERFYRAVIDPLRLEGDRGGNAPTAFAGPYLHETAWGLLLALFAHIHASDRLSEEARRRLAALLGATDQPSTPLSLYVITGKPGQAFDMQALKEFSNLHRLYRLYERWTKLLSERQIGDNPHHQIVSIFEQFWTQQGQNRETIWRDKVAWAILEFNDPSPFVEGFLYEARAREKGRRPLTWGTIEVLTTYLQEVFSMDEQFQKTLAGFGHSLGESAQKNNEMGLLYALRNAKNPEDFYRVLNDAQFRLQITIPETLLRIEKGERIAGVPWIRVKTLLSIYAMNAYLRKESQQPG
ncbi:hypothetical protein [Thermoflexus sp.]|uniref:hypothetical protein n=1 Tax=Thermoflexus sp. TaxID=1969742 RepID=UPI002ADD82B8|nr:hypothetical protein [Thermoflexus sp.]